MLQCLFSVSIAPNLSQPSNHSPFCAAWALVVITPDTARSTVSCTSNVMTWSSPSPTYSSAGAVLPFICWWLGSRVRLTIFRIYVLFAGFPRDVPLNTPVNCSPFFNVMVESMP